jgi:hypothetical protein
MEELFIAPARLLEILIAESTGDVLRYACMPLEAKLEIGRAARERCLADHTAERRALELLDMIGASAHEPARDLPAGAFSFLLFPVAQPELFDSVITREDGRVVEIQVKQEGAASPWVWGRISAHRPTSARAASSLARAGTEGCLSRYARERISGEGRRGPGRPRR